MAVRTRISMAQLVDLAAQLQADQARPERELRERDAAVGRELPDRRGDAAALLAGWLERVGDPDLPGHHARAALRTATGLLTLLGLGLGWASAAAVFRYDGTHPVNVIHVLAVYVLTPLLLLGLTALAAATGLGSVGETLRSVSPGRLIGALVRLLPGRYREAADVVFGAGRQHQRSLGAVQKWLVLAESQVFAVAFFAGAVLGATHLIVFTDLAFGWSTTLDAGADELGAVTGLLSAPWGWVWPGAVPTREAIEATLYRRGIDTLSADAPWRAWWPFLLMAIIVYGLLPRVVCLLLAARRLATVTRQTFSRLPGTAVVLDRLAPVMDVRTERTPTTTPLPPRAEARSAAAESTSVGGGADSSTAITLDWADAAPDRAALHAGGARSLGEDRQVIADAADRLAATPGARLIVYVRGWEPPMLELLDFLADLREAVGPDALIDVRPLDADASHHAGWQRKCSELGDPRLLVSQAEAPAHG